MAVKMFSSTCQKHTFCNDVNLQLIVCIHHQPVKDESTNYMKYMKKLIDGASKFDVNAQQYVQERKNAMIVLAISR